VLSRDEQRTWDDVRLFWADEVQELHRRRRPSRDAADPPTAVVAGGGLVIILLLLGWRDALLAVGIATGVGWALWHHWPRLSRQSVWDTLPDGGKDSGTRRMDEPGHRRRARPTDGAAAFGPGTTQAAGGPAGRWTSARRSGPPDELPAVVVGGSWGAVLLILFGVPWAGVAVGVATALIWLLWRFLPQVVPTGTPAGGSSPDDSGRPDGGAGAGWTTPPTGRV